MPSLHIIVMYVTSTIIYEVTDVPLQLFGSILEYHTFDDDDFRCLRILKYEPQKISICSPEILIVISSNFLLPTGSLLEFRISR